MTTETTTPTAAPHINDLRSHLMETLAALRDRENPMEPDRARAIAQVANVLVDTAKVEIDYLKATQQDSAPFLEQPPDAPRLPASAGPGPLLTGMSAPTVHRLKG